MKDDKTKKEAGSIKRKTKTRPFQHKKTEGDAKAVQALASFGVGQPEICNYIGISQPTLHKYYRKELDDGKAKGHAAVASFLFNSASGKALQDGDATYSDCLRSAMFYAKTRMGWRETQSVDLTNSDKSLRPDCIEIIAPTMTAITERNQKALEDGED